MLGADLASVYGLHCTCPLHVFMMVFDLVDLLALFGVYAGIISFLCFSLRAGP